MALLHLAARFGRACLVLGLVAGLALPGVAAALKPWLGELVAALLFLTAVRVGPRAALGGIGLLRRSLGMVVVLQLAAPLLALAVVTILGISGAGFAMAVVLVLAAPSITGSPNFAIMTGHDPAPAMRLLVLGTVLFPLTALPVLWGLPGVAGIGEVLGASQRLIVVILGAVGAGFFLRRVWLPDLGEVGRTRLDGLAAIFLGVVVVGLMAAIGPLARSDPGQLAGWLAGAFAVNWGLQIFTFGLLRRRTMPELVPVSIIAGNRNIALFLIALPEAVMDPLLVFIGCYQIPMYLTPVLLKRLYDQFSSRAG